MTDGIPALADLTTIRVGGTPAAFVAADDRDALIEAVLDARGSGEDWLLLGGGSNTVASDDGFDGTVIHVRTRGVERLDAPDGRVRIRVQAGEPWDDLVALTVRNGWSGIEALSGIPGSTGAAPVQNIGAYGQELAATLAAVDFLDRETGSVRRMQASELRLGYRTSVFKQGLEGIVLAVELVLHAAADGGTVQSSPVAYAQLADALGVPLNTRVPIAALRDTVLRLRSSKGMVLDDADPESVSTGSFFTNPIVSERFARTLPRDAPRWPTSADEPDVVVPLGAALPVRPTRSGEPQVKLSAAWLIEHAGVQRGFRLPGSDAHVSRKHTLALVNGGSATAAQVLELARYVQQRVRNEFGVVLQPEPVLVGASL
jgi:UDP-N-acetylmuramate dehydrogenase